MPFKVSSPVTVTVMSLAVPVVFEDSIRVYSLSFDFTTVAVTLPLALLIALAIPFRLVSPSARSTVSGLVVLAG